MQRIAIFCVSLQCQLQTNIQTFMKLTRKAKEKLNKNNGAKAKLCAAFDSSYDTIQRWIRDNEEDSKLTTMKALSIIETEIGLTQNEILTQ